jgi:hypothetical protein
LSLINLITSAGFIVRNPLEGFEPRSQCIRCASRGFTFESMS